MMESKIESQWEIDKIKLVLLTVFSPPNEDYLIDECNRLYGEHLKNYNEVVIFFFKSCEHVDNFINLFLGELKNEEDALKESDCFAKFIGSVLTFKEIEEDMDFEKFSIPISITQSIGIENHEVSRYVKKLYSHVSK